MGIRLLSACFLMITCLPLAAQVPSEPGDWPQWRGPNRDGINTESGLLKEWPEEGPKVVWRVDNSHVGGRFDDACGGQRLPNGNTVICAYHQKKPDKAKLFEVTREKKVVWEYMNPKLSGIHEIHVLTTNGKPVSGPPLK